MIALQDKFPAGIFDGGGGPPIRPQGAMMCGEGKSGAKFGGGKRTRLQIARQANERPRPKGRGIKNRNPGAFHATSGGEFDPSRLNRTRLNRPSSMAPITAHACNCRLQTHDFPAGNHPTGIPRRGCPESHGQTLTSNTTTPAWEIKYFFLLNGDHQRFGSAAPRKMNRSSAPFPLAGHPAILFPHNKHRLVDPWRAWIGIQVDVFWPIHRLRARQLIHVRGFPPSFYLNGWRCG